jgi:Holliday junction resolvase RusA-like endonuclease
VKIWIGGRAINKSNNNAVRINPKLWEVIADRVASWRVRHPKAHPWWIGPNDDAKAFQQVVAWQVANQKNATFGKQNVAVSIRLINQQIDTDGVKAVLDGIQDSGVIDNDRQVTRLIVTSERLMHHSQGLEINISLAADTPVVHQPPQDY